MSSQVIAKPLAVQRRKASFVNGRIATSRGRSTKRGRSLCGGWCLVRVFFIAPHCSLPCRALSQHVRCRTGFLLADASVAEQAFCLQISSTLLLVLTHAPRHVTQTRHRGTYVETNRQRRWRLYRAGFRDWLAAGVYVLWVFFVSGRKRGCLPSFKNSHISRPHYSSPIQWARGDVGQSPPPPRAPIGIW